MISFVKTYFKPATQLSIFVVVTFCLCYNNLQYLLKETYKCFEILKFHRNNTFLAVFQRLIDNMRLRNYISVPVVTYVTEHRTITKQQTL